MFKITEQAAEQVRLSMQQGDTGDMQLRIAAKKNPGGGLEYGMGFDNPGSDDLRIHSQGIDIIIAEVHRGLLAGTTMDYVPLEGDEYGFIFMNPHDENYQPTVRDK